ncbi:MAG TPA: helix-turn-helix transcriptional regulator [Candidatus Acidoferrales bacterium]|nr:helix-turn-helix transcriptional regulator [Candidatus Acidoferrales bacterium]
MFAKSSRLLTASQAAQILGISYPTLKQWIYHRKLRTIKTAGGHHRIAEAELDRFLLRTLRKGELVWRESLKHISGRNQLVGRILSVKFSGLLAQITLSIGEQRITSIITAGAARQMRLKQGDTVAALIKSTEVMIIRP